MAPRDRVDRELGWLVAGGDHLVGAFGWVGEHPVDGGDFSHLLLHPYGDGNAARMRELAEALGLVESTQPTATVPPEQAAAELADGKVTVVVWDLRPITAATNPTWDRAATDRGQIALWVGLDGLTGPKLNSRFDRYLARPRRLWMGLIGVTPRS